MFHVCVCDICVMIYVLHARTQKVLYVCVWGGGGGESSSFLLVINLFYREERWSSCFSRGSVQVFLRNLYITIISHHWPTKQRNAI